MGGYGDVQMIDENGVRADGRGPGDIRPITIAVSYTHLTLPTKRIV